MYPGIRSTVRSEDTRWSGWTAKGRLDRGDLRYRHTEDVARSSKTGNIKSWQRARLLGIQVHLHVHH